MKLEFDTDGGIGTRANLGVIVLQTDETLEHEFARMIRGPDVAFYCSRIAMVPEVRSETLARMERELPAAAALLPSAPRYDAIGYGCTSGATVIGSDRVARAVTSVCPGARVSDPLAAIVAAARALGARRLGFVTPYVAEVSARMRGKLAAAGFEIAGFGSFEQGNDTVVARIDRESILAAIENVAAQAPCDAVVISCTNLRCLDVIGAAEARIGVPVISSNQALAWHMLRLAGIAEPKPEFGRLFALG